MSSETVRPTDADRKGRSADAGRDRSRLRPALPSIDRLERSALLANDASEGLGMLYYIFLGYLTLICLGIAALKSPGTMTRGNELASDRAVFTSVNVATLTGFQLNVGPQFSPTSLVGPATFVALTLGGVLFALNAGGMAAVRILRMPYSDAQVLAASTVSTCLATLAGTTFLIGPGRGMFDAMLLALSSFGNSGVFVGRLPSNGSWQAHVGMMPLALFGALGLPVLIDVYEMIIAGRPLTRHSRVAIRTTAALYLVSIVVLTISRNEFWANLFVGFSQHGWYPSQGRAMRDAIISSSLQAVNARGAGFPFEYAGTLPRLTQWLLIGLMLIGGNSAGTAGGLKATTLVELFGGVRDALGGRGARRSFGVAATWVAVYGAIVVLGFFVLLVGSPEAQSDKLLFLSISAVGNAGLSHDSLSNVGWGLNTLSVLMLIGRLSPVAILWWMAATTDDADLAIG